MIISMPSTLDFDAHATHGRYLGERGLGVRVAEEVGSLCSQQNWRRSSFVLKSGMATKAPLDLPYSVEQWDDTDQQGADRFGGRLPSSEGGFRKSGE
jgi:hypothetical protein